MAKNHRRSSRRKLTGVLIFLVVLMLALLAVLFIYPMLLPKVDPFEYADVKFTGENGSGTAEVVLRTDLVGADASKITYTLSRNTGLIQGESVTVTAESKAYNLIQKEKTYTVNGLDEYLRRAEDLSDTAIMSMHEKTEAIIQMNLGDPSDSYGVKNELVSSEPSRIWLLTDDKGNVLYDVYRAEFKNHAGSSKIVYLVAYYENVLINPLDSDTFTFDTCMYAGDVISIGDAVEDSVVTGYTSLKAAKQALIDEAGQGKNFTYKKSGNDE